MSPRISRQTVFTATFLVIVLTFWLAFYPQNAVDRSVHLPLNPGPHDPSPREIAANSTLGVSQILVVWQHRARRTQYSGVAHLGNTVANH